MNILYVVIPAYNEADNIKKIVDDWYNVVESHSAEGASKLVIVNDGSTDDTLSILEALKETRPRMVILDKKNGGHGSALLCGYKYAIENKADFIFQTDSDGQTKSNEFEKFWSVRNEYDAIFGNRTAREDGRQRVFVEKVLCKILKYYFGVSLPDSNAPFRLMRTSYVNDYLPRFPENYNLPNVMLTVFGAYYKRSIKFIPIDFGVRQGGTNSINMKKIVKIGCKSVKEFKMIKRNMTK